MKLQEINMNVSNPNPTFIFIDGSYFCFYRYHSLLNWWKNACPEEIDVLQNPYQNDKFVDKFKKIFIDNIKKIPKNLKLDKSINPIIIVGKDCKREHIWRNQLFQNYKANRLQNDGFMGEPFFKMVYDDNLFIEGGAQTILKHPKLEADDCIAISVKYLLNTYSTSNIYIITSDKDYLQLAQERVQIYDLAFKKLTEQKSSTGDPKCDLFCKILTGDPSDNISSVFPRCGPKTAMKYYQNQELFKQKLQESTTYQTSYELNSKIIDFNNIPEELAQEFLQELVQEF
jgi:5'-3' exonuclease